LKTFLPKGAACAIFGFNSMLRVCFGPTAALAESANTGHCKIDCRDTSAASRQSIPLGHILKVGLAVVQEAGFGEEP
jgi:hypothetical protein